MTRMTDLHLELDEPWLYYTSVRNSVLERISLALTGVIIQTLKARKQIGDLSNPK